MKKLIFSALSIALLAGAMTSCGKTTKGKLSNDWKFESFNIKSVDTQENGDYTVGTATSSGSTITITAQEFSNGSSSPMVSSTGTVTDPTFKINKDGTWRIDRTLSFTDNSTVGETKTTTSVQMDSGTWSFIGKNKEEDFKKNERVLFNTLATSNNSTEVKTIGNSPSITTTSSTSKKFKLGELATIYIVKESKRKELELTTEASSSTTTSNGSSSNVIETSMKLVQ